MIINQRFWLALFLLYFQIVLLTHICYALLVLTILHVNISLTLSTIVVLSCILLDMLLILITSWLVSSHWPWAFKCFLITLLNKHFAVWAIPPDYSPLGTLAPESISVYFKDMLLNHQWLIFQDFCAVIDE